MGGGSPVLIGETGVPMNMRSTRNFADMSPCTCALNNTLRAIEIALVSSTLWNYTAENTNRLGDNWNGEDLSLFSADHCYDASDLHSGGRSLAAAVRPYALRTAGEPKEMTFDPYRVDKPFTFSFSTDDTTQTNRTVIFLPRYQYPHGALVSISEGGGTWAIDWKKQTLTYQHDPTLSKHTILVTKKTRKESLLPQRKFATASFVTE